MKRLVAAGMALVILALGVIALALAIVGGNTGSSYDQDISAYALCIADPERPLRASTSAGYVVRFDEDVALAHIKVQISKGNLTIEEIRAALDTTCKEE